MRNALLATAIAWLACAVVARADDGLEPYRVLARSPRSREILAFARATMDRYWDAAEAAPDSVPQSALPGWPGRPTGVYVSLAGHTTRACVGNATPTGTLAETVELLAIRSLEADRRHPPLRHDELPSLRILISFAGDGEPVSDPMVVDPAREGLLVSSPRGNVAFLPGEARTVQWALREARRIGVLAGKGADVSYRRFPVVVISEPARPAPREEPVDEGR